MKIASGLYAGKEINIGTGDPYIVLDNTNFLFLNSDTLSSYEILHEERRMSFISCVLRGLLMFIILWSASSSLLSTSVALIFGILGLVAGVITTKPTGIYTLELTYHDGGKSLADVNEKIFKAIRNSLFVGWEDAI